MTKKYKPYEINVTTLGFYVNRALWAMVKMQNKLIEESELNDILHAEFIVVKVLNELNGATQSQLSKVMGIERSAISRTVNSLEKKGYVERKPLNGSTNFVSLSSKSKKLIPTITAISNNLTELAFKGFSGRSRVSTINNLTRIYHNVLLEEDK